MLASNLVRSAGRNAKRVVGVLADFGRGGSDRRADVAPAMWTRAIPPGPGRPGPPCLDSAHRPGHLRRKSGLL